jgi:hypothetical protein
MARRVVHCGTGYVGAIGLRALLEQPDLELVGHYVSSSGKVGRDSGELVGAGVTGIIATSNWDQLLDLEADCLTYYGDSVNREREAIEDLVPFLERGTNVVTLSGWAVGHPATMAPDLLERVEAACRHGDSSCFFTGSDPGWATSDLAIATLAVANRVDSVRMIEFACFANYTAEYASREYFGFGQEPGYEPILVTGGLIEQMWAPTLHRLADVLGVEIDELVSSYETDSVDYDLEVGFGTVKAGTAAVVHFELQALNRGRPFATIEHVDRLPRDPAAAGAHWPQPYGPDTSYRIEVEGDPRFNVELGGHSSLFNVMPLINCIPALCEAPSGLLGPLDVPRYWTRNVTAVTGPWP